MTLAIMGMAFVVIEGFWSLLDLSCQYVFVKLLEQAEEELCGRQAAVMEMRCTN
ncbi:hypothetical protein ACLB1Q_23325 [Escherichia coli]